MDIFSFKPSNRFKCVTTTTVSISMDTFENNQNLIIPSQSAVIVLVPFQWLLFLCLCKTGRYCLVMKNNHEVIW